MLLAVTLPHPRIFYKVIDAKLCQEEQVTLPAGQYVFRTVTNPINPTLKDWMILDQPQLVNPDFSANDIIGMSYEYMLFWCQKPSLFTFNDLIIEMEEISEKVAVNDDVECINLPPVKLAKIIPLHLEQAPFARVPKKEQFKTPSVYQPIIARRIWSPAACRIMSCS